MDLTADVVAEIEADRKVNAIKLLREHQGIGLEEAKSAVDTYIKNHSAGNAPAAPETEGGIGRIVLLILGVGAIVGVYMYFT